MSAATPETARLWSHRNAPSWRAGLCLLLAVLFFYNPFFTIYGASGISHVQHPVSYRATVASSELRRCTMDPAEPLIPAPLQIFVMSALTQAVTIHPVLSAVTHDLSLTMPQVICDGIGSVLRLSSSPRAPAL